jgi:hypothetical protein
LLAGLIPFLPGFI